MVSGRIENHAAARVGPLNTVPARARYTLLCYS